VGLAESDSSLTPVCASCNLQADCQEPGSAPEPYARQLSMGYVFYPLHYTAVQVVCIGVCLGGHCLLTVYLPTE